jgi:hypothetical protein
VIKSPGIEKEKKRDLLQRFREEKEKKKASGATRPEMTGTPKKAGSLDAMLDR